MTVGICASFCTQRYSIFGVEYGGECWCGDSLGIESNATAGTDCDMPCGGNSAETCGAGNRLNVYISSAAGPIHAPYADTTILGLALLHRGY
jgi:hypothetical protein